MGNLFLLRALITLITIANNLGLELSFPSNLGPIRYVDNPHSTNSILDLIFLLSTNMGFGQHFLHSELQKPSDHIPLIIEVGIREVNINISIMSIKKDSKEEKYFIKSIM